jgi:hypothetical protein
VQRPDRKNSTIKESFFIVPIQYFAIPFTCDLEAIAKETTCVSRTPWRI